MSTEVIALLVLGAVFLVATVRPVNMGALALVATFMVGTFVFGMSDKEILAGFPGTMFVILVGVTYLFALAMRNGTVDWLVHAATRAVGGRIALMPFGMFLIPAAITAIGAAAPAACAITIPLALRFARRYEINPLLMSLMVIQGTTAGGFSPIGIYGVIVNGVTDGAGLATDPGLLFAGTFAASSILGIAAFLVLGGRQLIGRRHESRARPQAATVVSGTPAPHHPGTTAAATTTEDADQGAEEVPTLDAQRVATLGGLVALMVATLVFGLHVGFVALTIGVLLTVAFPATAKAIVAKVAWSTVLLISGIMTYVAMLEAQGTITWLGQGIVAIGTPLIAALVLLLVGAVVSAFASTTALLGAVIPLATPLLLTGDLNVTSVVVALCVCSSVVDCSPLSTMGALAVANSAEEARERTFRGLMAWGMSLVLIAPAVLWTCLILPTVR
ncbi:SLC13 family permease [Nonomuraea sp. NPDC050643]|uniref:SLC13 family permease n=1 Tax=Nonomuraea sp. NPDC050643 TaxID=3155660 RepID=UPI0033ED21AE